MMRDRAFGHGTTTSMPSTRVFSKEAEGPLFGDEQAQDPEWWSEEDFAWWSKGKKGKKGLSNG